MLVCATLLPAVGAVMWLYQRLSVPVVRATRSLLSDINSRSTRSLQGMPVIGPWCRSTTSPTPLPG